ncbi:pimeloyl-ACP methyl ester carboxylesterase [Lentzea atacamensis]|uniref:Pimeloyl-ACP methyl ester carboxylesterase n=1 Tax=Lentzea atacamensis TaxID=531938 RepID=A0A316I1K0_9PSEU|nr:alpha/beta hydrolase [Lentzea atacamensis]PWK86190.1 pimeloyl-ACP methyl ester carboxylesterase [Lentzea atacamensis]
MGTFSTYDGTKLAYHGPSGPDPLICLPGGPMQASSYLADLPLDDVLRLDLRGTGDSEEAARYRVDHQIGDVEALRRHLGLDRIRLLGHSAGTSLAILYATRFPQHLKELVLITPTPRVVGIDVTDDDRKEIAEQRHAEPWFEQAYAAFQQIWAGNFTPEAFKGITPFMHGRWDAQAQQLDDHPRNDEAAKEYYGEGAFDPAQVRSDLNNLDVPTLLLAGALDVSLPPKRAQEYADLFPRARLVVQAGAGHFPWVDDPEAFAATVQRIP